MSEPTTSTGETDTSSDNANSQIADDSISTRGRSDTAVAEPNGAIDGSPTEGQTGRRKVYESTLIPERTRNRVPQWVVLGGAVLLCGGLWWVLTQSQRHQYLSTAGLVIYSARVSPSASRLLMKPSESFEAAAKPLTNGKSDDTSPVFSPDGSQIAFLSTRGGHGRQVFVMDANGKNIQELTTTTGGKSNPSFAPCGGGLIGYTAAGILYRSYIKSDGSLDTDRLYPPPPRQDAVTVETPSVVSYAWSPAKDVALQGVAVVSQVSGMQSLAIIPKMSQDPVTTIKQGNNEYPLAIGKRLSVGWSPDGALLAVATVGMPLPNGTQESNIQLFTASGASTMEPAIDPAWFAANHLPGNVGPENPVFSADGSTIVFEMWDERSEATRQCLGLFSVDRSSKQPVLLYQGRLGQVEANAAGDHVLVLFQRADGSHGIGETGFKFVPSETAGDHFTADRRPVSGKGEDVGEFTISPQRLPKQQQQQQ